jgi:hypothetical protein
MKLIAIVIIAFTLFQCTIQKRVHQKGFHIAWHTKKANHVGISEKAATVNHIDTITTVIDIIQKNEISNFESIDNSSLPAIEPVVLQNSITTASKCGTITLMTGRKIEYSNYKLEGNTVLYKKCNDNFSDWQNIDLEDIETITDAKGKIIPLEKDLDVIEQSEIRTASEPTIVPEIEQFGLYSIAWSMTLSGIAGLILAIISLRKIHKNPENYKHTWISKLALTLALIRVFLVILIIIALYSFAVE